MNEVSMQKAAWWLAENTAQHLNQPTTPPIRWKLEDTILRVLLADGRTVRAPLDEVMKKLSVKKQTPVSPALNPKDLGRVGEGLPVHSSSKKNGRIH
jgi:hypothetical protein